MINHAPRTPTQPTPNPHATHHAPPQHEPGLLHRRLRPAPPQHRRRHGPAQGPLHHVAGVGGGGALPQARRGGRQHGLGVGAHLPQAGQGVRASRCALASRRVCARVSILHVWMVHIPTYRPLQQGAPSGRWCWWGRARAWRPSSASCSTGRRAATSSRPRAPRSAPGEFTVHACLLACVSIDAVDPLPPPPLLIHFHLPTHVPGTGGVASR